MAEEWNNLLVTAIQELAVRLLAGALIAVVGLIVGTLVGKLVFGAGKALRIDERMEQKGSRIKLNRLLAFLSTWIVYLLFFESAVRYAGFVGAADFLQQIILFVPNLVGALLIIIAGYGTANHLADRVAELEWASSDIAARIVFFLVLYLALDLALPLVGINLSLLNNIVLILVATLGLGLAIAIGLGLKDIVRENAESYLRKKKKNS